MQGICQYKKKWIKFVKKRTIIIRMIVSKKLTSLDEYDYKRMIIDFTKNYFFLREESKKNFKLRLLLIQFLLILKF